VLVSELAQLLFSVPAEAAEAVCNLLTEEGGGVEQRDSDTATELANDRVELLVWLPSHEVQRRVKAVEVLLGSLKEMGVRSEPWSWRTDPADPRSWEETYKRHFTTRRIGVHFVVKPGWETYQPRPGDLVIEMDPGMAFGTGLHPSTQLMLHALERLARLNPAPRCLVDLGCGTGILAIAAARLWPACRILAVDNDELAVQVCRENVARNRLEGRILVENRSAASLEGRPSLVLANINLETLTELHPHLTRITEEYGRLVLSGLLPEQTRGLSRLYTRDLAFELEYSEELDGWQSLILRLRG
jgi:ribosomal protein L11 methyltransferase